jgi:hypothetical protein
LAAIETDAGQLRVIFCAAPQVALDPIERAPAPASNKVKTVERGAIIVASRSH